MSDRGERASGGEPAPSGEPAWTGAPVPSAGPAPSAARAPSGESAPGGGPVPGPTPAGAPVGMTELGIDIIRVERIVRALEKHGRRFPLRILTPGEDAYVRDRPENLAGRWAAKEAVSKVLGLGVRGVGWREIEIVRLPTGQPTVRLHDRALERAQQLGMERIAVSISHEREYAVAVAVGVRTQGGSYVFPLDIDARLDDREEQLLGRLERLRRLDAEVRAAEAAVRREPAAPAEPIAHEEPPSPVEPAAPAEAAAPVEPSGRAPTEDLGTPTR